MGDEERAGATIFIAGRMPIKAPECPVNPFCLEVLRVLGSCSFSRLVERARGPTTTKARDE